MLLTALLMGLLGSLHCAIMCGPLALAVPVVGATRNSALYGRMVYNAGRLLVYSSLGIAFGMVGKSAALAGFQQSISLIAGLAMGVFLLLGICGVANPFSRTPLAIQKVFRRFLGRRSYGSTFMLGAANGFLPCGLVYMAGTASIACGNMLDSAVFMAVFGLGTLPVMLGITLCRSPLLAIVSRMRFVPIIPIGVAFVALSLILRGLALGIPYVSPAKTTGGIKCPACARTRNVWQRRDTAPEI